MNLKKALIASMLASSFGAIALPAQAQVIADIAPPPLQYEVVPGPRAGYVWEQARPGHAYVAPRWMERDGRWYYNERRWDRDGDGISNRRDRDRDGDGVPNRHDSHPNNPYRS